MKETYKLVQKSTISNEANAERIDLYNNLHYARLDFWQDQATQRRLGGWIKLYRVVGHTETQIDQWVV